MNQWFGHVVVGLLMDQCGRVEMFSIAKSLVSIAHSLNAIVSLQTKLLELAEEQRDWTRDKIEEIRENG